MSYLTYFLFRLFTFPLQFLPYSWLHNLGRWLGSAVYACYPKYRKRALSNLALATDLHLTPDQILSLAKQAIQSKSITALEYPRLSREKKISKIATCDNPEVADAIMQSGKGVIFFCGHQANWELLFLEGTSRMPGTAIGRPIKNRYLYRWVLSIREKFGGTIFEPKNSYRESMRALKQGKFVGIVGDQSLPNSGFSAPFLGREAWTSPLPTLLSKRSGCPIIVATIRRENKKYRIHYSDPIWPSDDQMRETLALFQASIKERPHEWLWTHNKWKQQPPGILKKPFRHDALALIAKEPIDLTDIRLLYPREQISLFTTPPSTPDYQPKLVVDFTGTKHLGRHFPAAQNIVHCKTVDEFLREARQ